VPSDSPRTDDPALITDLARDLREAGFTLAGVDGIWGEVAASALHRGHVLPALRALGGEPVDTLTELFVLGRAVAVGRLDAALPATGSRGAERLGLVRREGDSLLPLVDLRPYGFADEAGVGQWWIASDLGELALGRAIGEDHVLGVGGASLTLAGIAVQDDVATVLDLGTGCGIQAMHARRSAGSVVATDISARAVAFARFSAMLNGIEGIEFRLGDLYEPVRGQRFDRIVTNPPFVITPRVAGVPAYEYRDGGLVGDELLRRVLVGGVQHLAPGGVLQALGNWEYGELDGLERVREWVAGLGVDAWVIEREQQDVAEYAETWIRDGGTRAGTDEYDRLYALWLDDFARRGVTRVGFGYLTLRRPRSSRPVYERFERLPGATAGGLGPAIAQTLRVWDRLAEGDVGGMRLVVAPDVTEERHYWPGEEHPTVITLRQGGGFARSFPTGTALAAVVGACDGELTVRELCGAVAQLLEADADRLFAELLPQIEELLTCGFLRLP
jgi:methylase of polypeptide subunit release factors